MSASLHGACSVSDWLAEHVHNAAAEAFTPPSTTLLPCPFCGCRADWFHHNGIVGTECGSLDLCPGNAQTLPFDIHDAENAATVWNARAGSEA